jgi:hypothetical protein
MEMDNFFCFFRRRFPLAFAPHLVSFRFLCKLIVVVLGWIVSTLAPHLSILDAKKSEKKGMMNLRLTRLTCYNRVVRITSTACGWKKNMRGCESVSMLWLLFVFCLRVHTLIFFRFSFFRFDLLLFYIPFFLFLASSCKTTLTAHLFVCFDRVARIFPLAANMVPPNISPHSVIRLVIHLWFYDFFLFFVVFLLCVVWMACVCMCVYVMLLFNVFSRCAWYGCGQDLH